MKKILFCLIISLIIVSCFIPPWQRTYSFKNAKHYDPSGYSWLWLPPEDASSIDTIRLSIQIGLLLLLVGCVLFFHKLFPARIESPKKRKPISSFRRQFIRNKRWSYIRKIFFYPAFGFAVLCIIGLIVELIQTESRATNYGKQLHAAQEQLKIERQKPRTTGKRIQYLLDLTLEAPVEKVNSVYDGDTFRCDLKYPPAIGYKDIPIRIRGVDCPEIRGGDEFQQICAKKARQFTELVLSNGKEITLRNIARGKYFRILADVDVDGQDLAKLLLDNGFAQPYNP